MATIAAKRISATQKDKQKQLLDDFKVTFGSPEGERVLDNLMEATNLAKPLYDPNLTREMIYVNEGARNIGLYILSMLKYSPKDFIFNTGETQ